MRLQGSNSKISQQFGSHCLPNLRINAIEQPKAAKFTDVHPLEPGSRQPFRQSRQESFAIDRPVFSLLLKFHDAVPDEPIP